MNKIQSFTRDPYAQSFINMQAHLQIISLATNMAGDSERDSGGFWRPLESQHLSLQDLFAYVFCDKKMNVISPTLDDETFHTSCGRPV